MQTTVQALLAAMPPGSTQHISLPVYNDAPLDLTLVRGARGGQTLVVSAGVHGCEYIGVEALRRLRSALDPAQLSGNVVLLPLANPEGFYAQAKQVIPADQVNLNRAFPGDAAGSAAYRRAYAIERYLFSAADFWLDLHSGDMHEMVMPYAYFPLAGAAPETPADQPRVTPETALKACSAVKALSVSYRLGSYARTGLYNWAALRGIPSLLLERSGRCLRPEEDIAIYMRQVGELMAHLGIAEPTGASAATPQQELTDAIYTEAQQPGFWYPYIKEGQTFAAGACLGRLEDLSGNCVQQVRAAFDGLVLYYTAVLGVAEGDGLVAYARLAH